MKKHNVKLGIFFIGGLIVLILGLYFVGARQNLFGSSIIVKSCMQNAAGLQTGSTVQFVGISVGSIDEITIINDSTVCISMKIDKEQANFISKDAVVRITSDGLMGNKIVSIGTGDPSSGHIEDGDELLSKEPVQVEAIMTSVYENCKNLEAFTANLMKLSERIKNGEGVLGKMLMDTATEKKVEYMMTDMETSVKNIKTLSSNAKDISDHITDGDGLIGKLVYDDSMGQNVDQIVDSMTQVSSELKHVAEDLSQFANKLNKGEGSVSRLVNDTTMAKDLDQTIKNAKQRTAELEETIDIINNSWILNLFSKRNKKDKNKSNE